MKSNSCLVALLGLMAIGLVWTTPAPADVGGGDSAGETGGGLLTTGGCDPSLTVSSDDPVARLRAERSRIWREIEDINGEPLLRRGPRGLRDTRITTQARLRQAQRRAADARAAWERLVQSIEDERASLQETRQRSVFDAQGFAEDQARDEAARRAARRYVSQSAGRLVMVWSVGSSLGELGSAGVRRVYKSIEICQLEQRIRQGEADRSAMHQLWLTAHAEVIVERDNLRRLDELQQRNGEITQELLDLQRFEGRATRHADFERVGDPETPAMLRRGWMHIEPSRPEEARAHQARPRGVTRARPCE